MLRGNCGADEILGIFVAVGDDICEVEIAVEAKEDIVSCQLVVTTAVMIVHMHIVFAAAVVVRGDAADLFCLSLHRCIIAASVIAVDTSYWYVCGSQDRHLMRHCFRRSAVRLQKK